MQFINIVVHSVENMNFRVHLQYEFSRQGLDEYLEVKEKEEDTRVLLGSNTVSCKKYLHFLVCRH